MIAGVGAWGRSWRLAAGSCPKTVRVCIPARNEASKIAACVRAALAANPEEVVVVDDDSDDATAALATEAGAGDPRLSVIPALPRPEGWAGKPWACQCAGVDARSEWLLFIDADVRVDPGAISAAVARAEADDVSLLSLFGSWDLGSSWERIAIPAIGWFIRGATDLDKVNARPPKAAFANGQFLLIRNSLWTEIGGHGAVRSEVLDDVRMAERAQHGGIRLLWAPWAFRVRLYTGLADIVAGYQKNLYEGMNRRASLAWAAASAVFFTTVAPALAIPALLPWSPGLAAWAGCVVGLMTVFRWRIERRDGRSGMVAPLHVLGGAVLLYVLLTSALSKRAHWKGRAFISGQSS